MSPNSQVLIELTPSRPSLNPNGRTFQEQFQRKNYDRQEKQLIKAQKRERERAEKFRRRKITEQSRQIELQRKQAEDVAKRKETEFIESQERERRRIEESSNRNEADRIRRREQERDLTQVETQNLDVKVNVPVTIDVIVQ